MLHIGKSEKFIESYSRKKFPCSPPSGFPISDFFLLAETFGNSSCQENDSERSQESGSGKIENDLLVAGVSSLLAVTQEPIRMRDHDAVRVF